MLAFNLTSHTKKVDIKIDAAIYHLDYNTIEFFSGTNQKLEVKSKFHESNNLLSFEVEIPPLSLIIAILK